MSASRTTVCFPHSPARTAWDSIIWVITPETTQEIIANPPKVLIVAQADLLADDPTAAAVAGQSQTVIYLSLFKDEAPKKAFASLPIQSFAEHDGTFVNGERRVQRFYTATRPVG